MVGLKERKLERKKREKDRKKEIVAIIINVDCCRGIIWLPTHLKCEGPSLGQQCIRSLKFYTDNGPASSL